MRKKPEFSLGNCDCAALRRPCWPWALLKEGRRTTPLVDGASPMASSSGERLAHKATHIDF